MVHPVGEDGMPQYDRVVTCECSRERVLKERYASMLKSCQLPVATEDWTFDNFDASGPLREAYDAALELAEERSDLKWLTLVGPVDVGKSHLAVAICRRWLARGKPARYVLTPLMLDELRASYNHEGEYDHLMSFLKEVPLLVLDDIGTQKPTEWAMEKLMMVIDHRYVNGMHMVVTTNRSPGDLPGDEEHRISSRLLRAPFGRVVVIDALELENKRREILRSLPSDHPQRRRAEYLGKIQPLKLEDVRRSTYWYRKWGIKPPRKEKVIAAVAPFKLPQNPPLCGEDWLREHLNDHTLEEIRTLAIEVSYGGRHLARVEVGSKRGALKKTLKEVRHGA